MEDYIIEIKITINSKDRVVVIPMKYDEKTDALSFAEIQMEPMLNENEDISKDIVLKITQLIMASFKTLE